MPRILVPLASGALLLLSCQAGGAARCRTEAELSPALTPVQLSREAVACARQGDWNQASLLFGVAQTFSLYDARVEERAAAAVRQGWPGPMLPTLILRDGLDPGQMPRLQEAIRSLADEPARHRQLCDLLRRIGPPTYSPEYRVDEHWQVHGSTSENNGRGLQPALGAWEEVLSGPVDCAAQTGPG